MWYDKYFHLWQRKNVYDVYLEKFTNIINDELERVVVVLKTGEKGTAVWYYSDIFLNIGRTTKYKLQEAYRDAIEQRKPPVSSDYELYLKPTIGTTRSDPDLVSYIEKGYIPGFLEGNYPNNIRPKTDPINNTPKGQKV